MSVQCQQFPNLDKPRKKKRDEVRVDMLSVELCLSCPLPVEECRGAPSAHLSYDNRPIRCAYEQAIAERNMGPRMIELPAPRPDGVMRTWKVEVER